MITRTWIAALLTAVLVSACTTTDPPAQDIESVAILVLDDFDAAPEAVSGEAEQNCVYTGRQANVVGSTGAGDDLPAGVAHGPIVFEQLRSRLAGTPHLEPAGRPATPIGYRQVVESYVDSWRYRDSSVLLIGVDTAGFDTAEVTRHLEALVDLLETQQGITRFVVNMSFVVAPCNVRGWLDRYGDPLDSDTVLALYRSLIDRVVELQDLRAVLDSIVTQAPPERLLDALLEEPMLAPIADRAPVNLFYRPFIGQDVNALSDPLANTAPGRAFRQVNSNDPLILWLVAQADRTIAVAAAGNGVFAMGNNEVEHVQLDFPFAPGLWNSVVSVSASDAGGGRAGYSNSGEVMMDGTTASGVEGTSFAAPRLSAQQALYLLTGGPVRCGADIPPLGYVDLERSRAAGAIVSPLWKNLTVDVAAAQSCRDFTVRATLRGTG